MKNPLLGMVAKAWDSGIEEVGSGGSRVRGQPKLHETLSEIGTYFSGDNIYLKDFFFMQKDKCNVFRPHINFICSQILGCFPICSKCVSPCSNSSVYLNVVFLGNDAIIKGVINACISFQCQKADILP